MWKTLSLSWDGATHGIPSRVTERRTADNHSTFHSLLLPCNICKTLLFPTTPPHLRSHRPRKIHTQRCRHMHACNHSILHLCSGRQFEWEETKLCRGERPGIIQSQLNEGMNGHVQAHTLETHTSSLCFNSTTCLLLYMTHLSKWDPQRLTPTQTTRTTHSFIVC